MVTLPSKGPMRTQYVFVMAKAQPFFIGFLFSIGISGDSASYLIQINMLISLEYTMAQTKMVFGRVTLPSKGLMRGKYVFLTAKSQSLFYRFSIFN